MNSSNSAFAFLRRNWFEIIAVTSLLLLAGVVFTLLFPHATQHISLILGNNNKSLLADDPFRAKFASISDIKKRLRIAYPKSDSIRVSIVGNKIEMYDILKKNRQLAQYLAVMEDVPCLLCNDLHYLVKLSDQGKIQDIMFVTPFGLSDEPADGSIPHEFANQLIGSDIRDSHSKDNDDVILVDLEITHLFLQGLKDASSALSDIGYFIENK